jgi:hypothetical protein
MESLTPEETNMSKATSNATVLTGQGITVFQMLAQYHAAKLELVGMKHSRGSVISAIKRMYGIKGNKASVVAQFKVMVDAAKTGQPVVIG